MSLNLSPNSLYRQTTDCTEGGGLTREHCIYIYIYLSKSEKVIGLNTVLLVLGWKTGTYRADCHKSGFVLRILIGVFCVHRSAQVDRSGLIVIKLLSTSVFTCTSKFVQSYHCIYRVLCTDWIFFSSTSA
jgi:hypothetical protein